MYFSTFSNDIKIDMELSYPKVKYFSRKYLKELLRTVYTYV